MNSEFGVHQLFSDYMSICECFKINRQLSHGHWCYQNAQVQVWPTSIFNVPRCRVE